MCLTKGPGTYTTWKSTLNLAVIKDINGIYEVLFIY